jgi:hypothetical protein
LAEIAFGLFVLAACVFIAVLIRRPKAQRDAPPEVDFFAPRKPRRPF